MGKTFVRVDDRLIHGQTIVAWVPMLKIDEIIAVDDVSASNPMLKSIMSMGVPKQYKTHIVTTVEAADLLKDGGEANRLLIVKVPHKLSELKDEIASCEHVYLGNMAKREDTDHQMTAATGIFYLSDADIEEIDDLVASGLDVTFQQLPNSQEKTWSDFKASL